MLGKTLKLSGYSLGEALYEGTRTRVYRATRLRDTKPVIIKFLRNEYPSFNELVQFRNQYTIAKNLNLPGIIPTYNLEHYGNGYALVMEDFGGMSLGQFFQKHLLDLKTFLAIAIQLADLLYGLYQNRVIHKDLKPANILIHPDTKQVKLIDFSISSLLPRETQEISNPNILEGTLAYISPEQTGRMNRGIDYRTDFYALGVTLFELITGELPFKSDDAMELVHCHLASSALPIHQINSHIPGVISEIVAKLMAKNAEDRYQSALGLKYDLQICLTQLKETEKIEDFEIGQRDICDRFIIPEKLYGRETEVKSLLDAFERVATGSSEMMLVAGFSGIGKTAVVNEVHKPITRQQGYFIKGKFDQFNRNIPFSAFVQAFRSLVGQLLGESDENLAMWKAQILEAVGENGQVVIDVIPELERIIGQQPPVASLSGSAAQNRFNLLFGKFIRVFTTKEHPLVIFLDDLQWADSASLNLLKLLMNESETGYLLVLGAYRDNEVFPAHPLMLTLDDIKKQGANINTLTLSPLDEVDITRLVADTLLCSTELASPLADLVYQKTQGNPFFTTQFLKGLYEEGCITFNPPTPLTKGGTEEGIERGQRGVEGGWQCNLAKVRQLALTDDVVAFMVGRLRKLPEATQAVLKLAACIGNQFDLETLAVVCEGTQEQVATDLWRGLQEGFVVPENETYKFFQGDEGKDKSVDDVSVGYRFLHDRVQQAAYSLIPDDQKQATHFKVGQLIMHNLSPQEQEEKIFAIVNQLNCGVELISNLAKKEQLIRLNLSAGRRAKASTAYGVAVKYFGIGRELLGAEGWQSSYELTLALYEESAEVAYLNTDFEQTKQLSEVVLQQAKTLLDRVNIYVTKIQSNIAQVKLLEAVQIALKVLNLIDDSINLPEEPNQSDFEQALVETQSNLADQSTTDLLHLPQMDDPYQLAAMHILASVAPPAYFAFPTLLPLIAMRMVNLSIKFGNTSSSAFGYAMYSFILCGIVDNIESGYQFGQLALNLVDKFNATDIKSKVLLLAGHFIKPWRESVRKSLLFLPEAYQIGLEFGDLEFAGYSASFYCFNSIFVGKKLENLEKEIAAYGEAIAQIKQEHVLPQIHLSHQTILNLLNRSEHPCFLIGDAYNEVEMICLHEQANNRTTLAFLYVAKLSLCYLFQDYKQAIETAVRAEEYLDGAVAMLCIVLFYFYDSLVKLVQFSNANSIEQSHILEQVEYSQAKMKYWADRAPMNYQHKYDLVEAERNRVLGQKGEAIELYDRAIAGAKANEYIQEEALANELAAKFYLDWGKEKVARSYMQEAYYCYARWGAKAKTDQLEQTYPQLLAPILQQPQFPLNPSHSLTSPQPLGTVTTATSVLDLASAIKASRAISGEIELDVLLSKLMYIVLENAGADKAGLILNNSGTWEIAAQCEPHNCYLSTTPLDQTDNLPHTIINTVKRTQQTLSVNNTEQDNRFTTDPYFVQQPPKSLFCTPILNQGKLIGILYLENHLTAAAFTPDRIEVLNLLTAQAAISIENARLYHRLEDYSRNLQVQVEHRTQQLQEKNQHLQQTLQFLQHTQTQLIQAEKMSGLGQMVAGIAHEINNPISFIAGNISHAREYFHDLLELLDLYQENSPYPSGAIQKKLEEIELDFLQDDLENLFYSMQTGSDRIRQIILGLRNFSRLDESERKPVDIHEGFENTLLMVQHRLKPQGSRPEIAIVKNYGELPPINCYASQLNQVFLHLLTNAIDVLTSVEGKDHPKIHITTEMKDSQTVKIMIADNGTGMSETVRQRIFDPFFTTKPVGKGTGLGLSISYQIVTEQHGGQLQCVSQPGQGTEFMIDIPI